MKWFFLLSLSLTALAEAPPKPNVFVFNTQKPACSLVDGKLVLARVWPFGSWEECAYSLLLTAQQLDKFRDEAVKQAQSLQVQLQQQSQPQVKPKK